MATKTMTTHQCGRSLRMVTGLLPVTAAAALAVLYVVWMRPRLLTWGATDEEVAGSYPGDDILSDAGGTTMATTLPAPPEAVWAWLVQMGGGRGGWYSRDWLDNNGEPSADRIVPEWQSLEVGQRLGAPALAGENWFTVVHVEPCRSLVLRGAYGMFSGRAFDPGAGPIPRVYVDGIWGFHLTPAPGDQTRLVTRTRGQSRPRWLARAFGFVIGEPMHVLMQTKQFDHLRDRLGARP